MLKPNYVGNQLYFDSANHSITTLNNTIVGAVKSAITSNTVYPHAYTSVLNDDRDHHSWVALDSSTSLTFGNKYSCGLFIPDTKSDGKDNVLLTLFGSVVCSITTSSHTLSPFFFLGRTASSSVTQSDASPSNAITNYMILPDTSPTSANTGSTCLYRFNLKLDIPKVGYDTNAYPLCFGFCIENPSGSVSPTLNYLRISLGFQTNNSLLPVYRPTGF